MGHIKLDNEIIPERRSNAKLRLDLADWIKIISVVIVVILGWGNIKWTVNNHSEVLASQAAKLETTTKMANDSRKDIEGMKENINEIKSDVKTLLKRK